MGVSFGVYFNKTLKASQKVLATDRGVVANHDDILFHVFLVNPSPEFETFSRFEDVVILLLQVLEREHEAVVVVLLFRLESHRDPTFVLFSQTNEVSALTQLAFAFQLRQKHEIVFALLHVQFRLLKRFFLLLYYQIFYTKYTFRKTPFYTFLLF